MPWPSHPLNSISPDLLILWPLYPLIFTSAHIFCAPYPIITIKISTQDNNYIIIQLFMQSNSTILFIVCLRLFFRKFNSIFLEKKEFKNSQFLHSKRNNNCQLAIWKLWIGKMPSEMAICHVDWHFAIGYWHNRWLKCCLTSGMPFQNLWISCIPLPSAIAFHHLKFSTLITGYNHSYYIHTKCVYIYIIYMYIYSLYNIQQKYNYTLFRRNYHNHLPTYTKLISTHRAHTFKPINYRMQSTSIHTKNCIEPQLKI